MKIVVLSGGSGNDALIRGLKKFYPDCDVKVIVNAYDNGKSTGVCRKITNTLGVSDIRKNHIRLYKATVFSVNKNLVEFYENRYDFDSIEKPHHLLIDWGLADLYKYVVRFFERCSVTEFKDFNIANIVYSEMYSELGYEETNQYFCNLLGIDDFVILNSFDNVFINAVTSSFKILNDEGDIVEYKNAEDPIKCIFYTGENNQTLNPKAIDLVLDANLIIISTGTFWSSIYPTLHYADFWQYINNSSAKKLWVINNEEDKDAYGVTSNNFITYMESLGLDLTDFTILENLDAKDSLQQDNPKYRIVKKSMGNINGKHDGDLYAKEVYNLYYGIDDIAENTKYVFDFDDTI